MPRNTFVQLFLAASLLVSIACGGGDRVRLYASEPIAPSYTEDQVADLEVMGSTLVDHGVNFAVYSKNATRVDLLLFDDPEANLPVREYKMERFGDVWNTYVEGIGRGQHYGYVTWGPNWPEHDDWFPGSIHGFVADVDQNGNRFNPNKLLIDPYARAIHRDHDWSKGSIASGPARTESTYAASSKSIVWSSDYEWSSAEEQWRESRRNNATDWNELIIYEVHLKDLTASPASGVEHPGTYKGVAEQAPYLADLGITAVEFMPLQEKPLDGGYWGYQTLNFFAPELSYAATIRPLEIIDEFKAMVEALHAEGIEVFVDVVYNHTGEGGLWREKIQQDDVVLDPNTRAVLVDFDPKEVAGLYSFRGLDNAEYYALDPDNQTYWNNTGVGNQTRPNNRPFRRLIIDSLRFYTEELHVDGFRFDLAPVLAASDDDYNSWAPIESTVVQEIVDDPVLGEYNTRIIAEPWAAGGDYGFSLGGFPASSERDGVGWYEWNAHFRDWWRSFTNHDEFKLNSFEGPADGGYAMTGSYDTFNWNGRRPYHSVNFITAHDGFTLYDLVTYDEKVNACGPLNPMCCENPLSSFCDVASGEDNNRSRDWGDEALKRQQIRNFFVGLFISHGTPMMLGGDEWMRTQLGNNNAYSTNADNSFNWYDWGVWQPNLERTRMHDFVRKIIAFRKANLHAFAPSAYGESAPYSWRSAANDDQVAWDGRHLMQHYYDPEAGAEILILLNHETGPVTFTLPGGRAWQRVLDTQSYYDTADFFSGSGQPDNQSANFDADETVITDSYQAEARSIIILRGQ